MMVNPQTLDVTQVGACVGCGREARLDAETGVWPDRVPADWATYADAVAPDAPWVCTACAVGPSPHR